MSRIKQHFATVLGRGLVAVVCGSLSVAAMAGGRPAVSSVELTTPLQVPVEQARVFLQGGKVVSRGALDHYRPHCSFETRALSDGNLVIPPQTFEVERIRGLLEEVVGIGQPVRIADMGGSGDGGPTAWYEGYHFRFAAPNQGDVMRMSCRGVYAEPQDLQPPTLDEIREALGDLARVRAAS